MGARWTPLAALVAVLAALLAAAGVVSAVAYEDDDDSVAEARGGAEVTTTTTVTIPEATTSTTVLPPETTTTSPPTTTPRTTTTRRTTTTTTRRTTTTAAPRGPAAVCAADQIDVSGRPERLDYRAGQPVTVRTTIRNRSASPCSYNGYTVTITFVDPGGAPIVASSVIADDFEVRTFAPGATFSHSATWEPSEACVGPTRPCPTPAAGIYSTQTVWGFSGGRYTATQDFVLR